MNEPREDCCPKQQVTAQGAGVHCLGPDPNAEGSAGLKVIASPQVAEKEEDCPENEQRQYEVRSFAGSEEEAAAGEKEVAEDHLGDGSEALKGKGVHWWGV